MMYNQLPNELKILDTSKKKSKTVLKSLIKSESQTMIC